MTAIHDFFREIHPSLRPPLQIRAFKQVMGGTLQAGQFEFALERECGCMLVRSRNDAAGWIHFVFDPHTQLPPQGEWLILRELPPPCPLPGWKLDTTRYRVFVRPYDGVVIYQGPQGILPGPPIFINRLRSTSSISGTVRTSTEYPIPGWRVFLYRDQDDVGSPPMRSQLTDCRGRYSFEALPRGRYRILAASRDGWQSAGCTRYAVTLDREPVTGIDFVFERTRSVCFDL